MGIVCSSIGNRLGNQMCAISAGLSFAKKYDKKFVITSPYDHNLNSPSYTTYDWIDKRFEKIKNEDTECFCKIVENHHQDIIDFDEYSEEENIKFIGVYHSDKYYDKDYVREIFGNTDEDKKRIYEKYGELSDTVSLSVRRGDYLSLSSTFISPTPEWYERCYKKYFDGSDILVTSDDIDWCKESIKFGTDNVMFLEEPDAVETLKIKQMCKKHIIPPSTYSWWSAYLSGDDSTVVTPSLWYTERSNIYNEGRYVDTWIKEKI